MFLFQSIASGMLIAGVIKEIHDYDMDISLPNGITGYLPITNISSSYTELLHQLTEGDAAVSEVCSCFKFVFLWTSQILCAI